MEQIQCDVLVVGGGAAGGRAALEAKKAAPGLEVLVAVDGGYDAGGSTNLVASEALGINAPFDYMGDGDSADVYFEDMMNTGGGLSDPKLCRVIAEESCDRIKELMDLGVRFAEKDGRPEQQKLSGCTRARSLTCGGSTGRQIAGALKKAALGLGVKLLENVRIVELCKDGGGAVCGALGRCGEKDVRILAKAVILATGGAGNIFSVNVTPSSQKGDGWAMAYQAGCRFVSMEFFQIGPAVAKPGMKFIIHSHMWRFLPRLTNALGEEFLQRYCGDGVSAREALDLKAMSYPFSVRTDAKYVDIAVFQEIMAGRGTPNGGVYFDVTHVPRQDFLARAPITYRTLLKAGIDCSEEVLELTLAVQNFNGGVLIDENGFTGVKGLYAAGEITGGVHGSDRPGGNNLTDTQVFGYRAGRAAAEYAASAFAPRASEAEGVANLAVPDSEERVIRESERLFYRNLTVVRTKSGLEKTKDFLEENLRPGICLPLRNRLLVGGLLTAAETAREESRGTHYREDFPQTDPAWRKRLILQKGPDGSPTAHWEP